MTRPFVKPPLVINYRGSSVTEMDMRDTASHPEHVLSLVSIVHTNLQHQADWSGLKIHATPNLPRPLISGVPPGTIYVDPDSNSVQFGGEKSGENLDSDESSDSDDADGNIKIDREWVLPVDLREKWTIRQWAEIFDSIPAEPPGSKRYVPGDEPGGVRLDASDDSPLFESQTRKRKKRLVMGIVSGDSTVVYYIVHDGIVKPRQN